MRTCNSNKDIWNYLIISFSIIYLHIQWFILHNLNTFFKLLVYHILLTKLIFQYFKSLTYNGEFSRQLSRDKFSKLVKYNQWICNVMQFLYKLLQMRMRG